MGVNVPNRADFKIPTEKVDLKKLGDEIAATVVPLRNINFNDKVAASYLGLLPIKRSTDMDAFNLVKEMGADESSNRVGLYLLG